MTQNARSGESPATIAPDIAASTVGSVAPPRSATALRRARTAAGVAAIAAALLLPAVADIRAPGNALCVLSAAAIGGFLLAPFFPAGRTWTADERSRESVLITVGVVLVVALGLYLRARRVAFGLPHPYHPDELMKSSVVRAMLARGNLDPDYFLHPTLLLYLAAAMQSVLRTLGSFGLAPQSLVGEAMPRIVLGGRLVSCIAGTITIAAVYALARRVFDTRVALSSALLIAVFPLHATCSRYFKEDSLLTLFTVLAALFVVRAYQERRQRDMLLAAVFAGLAIGTKYSGALLLLPLFIGLIVAAGSQPTRTALPLIAVPLVFLCTTPYAVLTPAAFLGGVRAESAHARSGHRGAVIDPWDELWTFHLRGSLVPGAGLITTVLAIAAAIALLRRRNVAGAYIAAIGGLFFVAAEAIPSKPFPQPDRYILPALPFAAILAGAGIDAIINAVASISSRHALARLTQTPFILATVAVAAGPAFVSFRLLDGMRRDTRMEMRAFMDRTLPVQAKVLTAGGSVYLPLLPPDRYRARTARSALRPFSGAYVDRLRQSGFQFLLVSEFDSRNRYYAPPVSSGEAGAPGDEAHRAVESEFPLLYRAVKEHGSYGFHDPVLSLYDLRTDAPEVTP